MGDRANRLINSKSPYLRQHAYDPVDWYPWGEEAFKMAKERNVPIFLSIGYSTCHWCHVMREESFSDEEVAKLLNENFVSIKVDREERPDVDEFYMNVCQLVSRSCGWPLNLFLTPDREPFLVFTYLPKESRMGVIGFKDLVLRVVDLWQNKRSDALMMAANILNAYRELLSPHPSELEPSSLINGGYTGLLASFDSTYGGFGGAPKFPQAQKLLFLIRYFQRSGKQRALEMVKRTLDMIRMGGVYDQVGFGVHRYSTDKYWKLPHFEKMLYDQALVSRAYLETYNVTGEKFYLMVAEEILEYVSRDLASPEGAFYSAEDAESEGVEGKFYTWTLEEIKEIYGSEAGKLIELFNMEEKGNYLEEATGEKTGRNILHIGRTPEEIIKKFGFKSREELLNFLHGVSRRLFPIRDARVRPDRDEKILTDWNSLMIISYLLAYRLSGKDKYLMVAERALRFILENMYLNGLLYHSYIDGELTAPGFLEDYVFLSDALLEAYWATYKVEYLSKSVEIMDKAVEKFWDQEKGFLLADPQKNQLPMHVRRVFEGSTPPGNIYASYVLTKLGLLIGRGGYLDIANKSLELVGEDIASYPEHYPTALIALDMMTSEKVREVVVATNELEDVREILTKNYNPYTLVLVKEPTDRNFIENLATYTKNMGILNGKTTIYICKRNICDLPTNDIAKLREVLGEK